MGRNHLHFFVYINNDNIVDIFDAIILARNFGRTT